MICHINLKRFKEKNVFIKLQKLLMAEEKKEANDNQPKKRRESILPRVCSTVSWAEFPLDLEEEKIDFSGPLLKKAASVRSQEPIDWLPYLEAGLISKSDYDFLRSYQSAETRRERDAALSSFRDDGLNVLVPVVQKVCILEELQYFLVLIDDMLWEDMSRILHFEPEKNEPWTVFLDLLPSSDEFVKNLASCIVSKFFRVGWCSPDPADLAFYFNWLKNELRYDNRYLTAVARCLQKLLRFDEYRVVFYNLNGIYRITRVLCEVNKPQEQYQLVFCLWMASFNIEIAEKMNRFSVIAIMVEILESAPAEVLKLPRVIMATIRNLLVKPRDEETRKNNALILIQCKICRMLDIIRMRGKTLSDPEFKEDCEVIDEILSNYVQELSTFDEYQLEVKSRRLEWSVVHTSKPFWEECAGRLNDNKYELLKILISLLETSDNGVNLCVAAHDLGEYMTHYPRGRQVVAKLGGKEPLLDLLSHKHPEVKYHALKSLQILMLSNFDLLNDYVSDRKRTLEMIKAWNK